MSEIKKKYGIGIVGCGTISEIHADAIRQLEGGELVCAMDLSVEKGEAFSKAYGIPVYSDYQQFLSRDDLDIVVVCTPSGTHLDNAIPAADAGKHLIIEKPLEITMDRANQLIRYCKKQGVQLAVIFQSRFMEDVRKMKKAIDEGVIGKIIMARISVKWFRDQDYYKSAPWRGTLKLDGGGALINQSIHTVDLLVWMAGPVASVHAFKKTLTHENLEGEDTFVASLCFENGALGVMEASTSIVPAQNRIVEINGTLGTATLDGNTLSIKTGDADTKKEETGTKKEAFDSAGAASPLSGVTSLHHLDQYRAIIRDLEKGVQPAVSGEECLKSLALIEASYRSCESGKPVSPQLI